MQTLDSSVIMSYGFDLVHSYTMSTRCDTLRWVTLPAFHGHIDFSPPLQIIAGSSESYPPKAAGWGCSSVLTQELLSDFGYMIS